MITNCYMSYSYSIKQMSISLLYSIEREFTKCILKQDLKDIFLVLKQ